MRGYTPSEAERTAAAAARAARAHATTAAVLPVIRKLQAAGSVAFSGLARALTQRGVPTPGGAGAWQPVPVQRVLDRAG